MKRFQFKAILDALPCGHNIFYLFQARFQDSSTVCLTVFNTIIPYNYTINDDYIHDITYMILYNICSAWF